MIRPNAVHRDLTTVIRVAMILSALASGFFAAHGGIETIRHAAREIPPGPITRVDPPRDGGQRITIAGGATRVFPADVLRATGRPRLNPGTLVEKRRGSFLYWLDGQPVAGRAWVIEQWLLPARVTIPLAVYFMTSAVLVFRNPRLKRPLPVELVAIPVIRWLGLALAMMLAIALVNGLGQLVWRSAG